MIVGVEDRVDRKVVGGDGRRFWVSLSGRMFRRRVDPHSGRQIGGEWPSVDEALRMRRVRERQDVLALRADRDGLAEVHDGGREKAQAAVTVLLVVPGKKDLPKRPTILDRSESLGKLGSVLERFELGF